MEKVRAVRVDEIRKARRAANAGNAGDFLVRNLPLLHHLEINGENGKIAASRAPRRMIGDEFFLGVFRSGDVLGLSNHDSMGCFNFSFISFKISRTLNGKPSVLLIPRIFGSANRE